MLSADRKAQFDRDGFLWCPGICNLTAVDVLRAELTRCYGDQWAGPWQSDEAGKGFHPIHDLHRISPAWEAVAKGLEPMASALLGVPAELAACLGIVKPPEIGQSFPLHQDGVYYGPRDGRYVYATLYLDDVTADNGSIRFLPGSHHTLLTHCTTTTGKQALPPDQYRLEDTVLPWAKAGDVTWAHLWTIHGSAGNTSTAIRRTARIGFTAKG